MLNVGIWKAGVVVVLEKIKDRYREQLGDDANVIPVIEPVDEVNAMAARERRVSRDQALPSEGQDVRRTAGCPGLALAAG